MDINKYSIIIVAHSSDLELAKQNIPVIYHFLKPKQIVIISNKDAIFEIKQMKFSYVKFMDEDKIMPSLNLEEIKNLMQKRYPYVERAGWYFQQFLKMAYATICADEWYLIWDADTIPLRKLSFFTKDGKGILDIKSEYHKPYFRTIKKILGINKIIEGSFISEHMLINKKAMIELIYQIEQNSEIKGIKFFEKVIYALNIKELKGNGFSEYETYGNFVMKNFPEIYSVRKLRTLREGKILLGACPDRKVLKWASNSYDIISLEKYHKADPILKKCTKGFLRNFISMRAMWNLYKRINAGRYYE